MDLMQRLRAETRDQHARLHHLVDVEQMLRSPGTYAKVLGGFYRAVAPVEAAIEVAIERMGLSSPATGDWRDRLQKTHWLHSDLRLLGAWDESRLTGKEPARNWSCDSLEMLVGQSYVLEGMTLGATQMAPRIRERLGYDLQTGARFYHGYGGETQPRWQAFRRWVGQCGVEHPSRVTNSARQVFEHFAMCLADQDAFIAHA